MAEILKSREIILGLMLICAVVTAVNYYFSEAPALNFASVTFTAWGTIVSAFSVVLGAVITLRFHGGRIMEKTEDWQWSIWLIACMVITYGIGLTMTTSSSTYQWIVVNVLTSLAATVYSLVGLFCITAAYRAFRVRNLDAAILLVVAVIIIIGRNIPIGEMISPALPDFAKWILDFPQTGARRGTGFAGAIIGTGYTLRMLIGRERGA
jgi:hypothetical protein